MCPTSHIPKLPRFFVSVDIFKPRKMEADETKSGPMIRDTVRLSVIRYGDTTRDTFFGPSDTPMLRDV
jgi:hypothetical protein